MGAADFLGAGLPIRIGGQAVVFGQGLAGSAAQVRFAARASGKEDERAEREPGGQGQAKAGQKPAGACAAVGLGLTWFTVASGMGFGAIWIAWKRGAAKFKAPKKPKHERA